MIAEAPLLMAVSINRCPSVAEPLIAIKQLPGCTALLSICKAVISLSVLPDKEIVFTETTEVSFYDLSQQQTEHYVNNYQPFDKAGGYAIQEWIGLVGIKEIKGDYYNVMGLPVARLLQELKLL